MDSVATQAMINGKFSGKTGQQTAVLKNIISGSIPSAFIDILRLKLNLRIWSEQVNRERLHKVYLIAYWPVVAMYSVMSGEKENLGCCNNHFILQ